MGVGKDWYVVVEDPRDGCQEGGPLSTEEGAAREKMFWGFVRRGAAAHRGGTVYETMIKPVIPEVTAVNSDLG